MAVHRPRPDRRARRVPAQVALACLLLAGATASLAASPPPTAEAPLERLRDTPRARAIESPRDPVRPPAPAPADDAAEAWWRYRERPAVPDPRPPIERPRPRPPGGGGHPAYRPLPPVDAD